MRLSMNQLISILETDILSNNACIEINFQIPNNHYYSNCWLGKKLSKEDDNKVSIGMAYILTEAVVMIIRS